MNKFINAFNIVTEYSEKAEEIAVKYLIEVKKIWVDDANITFEYRPGPVVWFFYWHDDKEKVVDIPIEYFKNIENEI